jgi:hypothetical protein
MSASRRWSFSLRELLLLVALCGTALGWWRHSNLYQEEIRVGELALRGYEVLRHDPRQHITHGLVLGHGTESFWITVTRPTDELPELNPRPALRSPELPARAGLP